MTPTDDHRRVYDLIVNQHPNGLTRDELAERSGLGDRKMRAVLEDLRIIAATKPHPRFGPLVLGFDPELQAYTFGKDAAQRGRIMAYYAARLRPMHAALSAQAKAAEHHGLADPATQELLFDTTRTLSRRAFQ